MKDIEILSNNKHFYTSSIRTETQIEVVKERTGWPEMSSV